MNLRHWHELPIIETFGGNENERLQLRNNAGVIHDAHRVRGGPSFHGWSMPRTMYHAIQSLTVDGNGASSLSVAQISLPGSLGAQSVFLDTLLHVAGFMLNICGNDSGVYICSGVWLLKVLHELVQDEQSYSVCCINYWNYSRDL